jgi:hypothetical protein
MFPSLKTAKSGHRLNHLWAHGLRCGFFLRMRTGMFCCAPRTLGTDDRQGQVRAGLLTLQHRRSRLASSRLSAVLPRDLFRREVSAFESVLCSRGLPMQGHHTWLRRKPGIVSWESKAVGTVKDLTGTTEPRVRRNGGPCRWSAAAILAPDLPRQAATAPRPTERSAELRMRLPVWGPTDATAAIETDGLTREAKRTADARGVANQRGRKRTGDRRHQQEVANCESWQPPPHGRCTSLLHWPNAQDQRPPIRGAL